MALLFVVKGCFRLNDNQSLFCAKPVMTSSGWKWISDRYFLPSPKPDNSFQNQFSSKGGVFN